MEELSQPAPPTPAVTSSTAVANRSWAPEELSAEKDEDQFLIASQQHLLKRDGCLGEYVKSAPWWLQPFYSFENQEK